MTSRYKFKEVTLYEYTKLNIKKLTLHRLDKYMDSRSVLSVKSVNEFLFDEAVFIANRVFKFII